MLRRQRLMFAQLGQRLEQAWITETRRRRQQLEHSAGRLQALSPLATLERGYAIVTRVSDGVIVRDPDEVATAERVQAQLARGRLICRVEKDG
jgi:exodeoxyribonuclease VII large subunit